jgi:hypothetical protein
VTGKLRAAVAPTALLPAAVVLGLLVLVWAATTGPVALVSPSGRIRRPGGPPVATPTPSTSESPTGNLREVTRDVRPRFHLAWLGDLIVYALFIGLCVGAFLLLRMAWQHRWRPPAKPAEVDFVVLPDVAVERALQEDAETWLATIEEGAPRNGIVACWLRLEEIAGAAGYPRARSETSSEYVVRVLKSLDLDPRAIATLAALFREARFSEHRLGEESRTAARSALQVLHEDLRARGAVR